MIDRIDNLIEIDKGSKFAKIYAAESRLLAEVLRDADQNLYKSIITLVEEIEEK